MAVTGNPTGEQMEELDGENNAAQPFLTSGKQVLENCPAYVKKNSTNPPVVYILHMINFFPTTAKYSPADSLYYSCILVL